MRSKIICTIFLITLFFVGSMHAQTLNTAKLDSLFDVLLQKNLAMGSVTISRKGKIVYERSIGYRFISDKEKLPATADTKYRIGSVSKTITAAMIFQLIDEGKLSLSTTMDKYFPDLPNAKLITVSNLLNHRSGLHNYTDRTDFVTWAQQPINEKEMLDIIIKRGIDFQPDEKAAYSNSNYFILGYLLEKITKKSFAENLKRRVTAKLGLSNTYVKARADLKANESFSYEFSNGWIQKEETDIGSHLGAGCIVSTPTDLTHFVEGLFTLRLITKSSLDSMKTIKDEYGRGIFEVIFFDKKGYGHGGLIDGFLTRLRYYPEDSLAIAYCSNGHQYPINDIMIGITSICFNRPYVIPSFERFYIQPETLEKYVGVYSNEEIPLKITITRDSTSLIAQATGQIAFPLEATEEKKFKYDPVGAKIEFRTEEKQLILKQRGGIFVFEKIE